MKTQRLGRYMEAVDQESFFRIRNFKSKMPLGVIEWYEPFKSWAFHPSPGTVFSEDCLQYLWAFAQTVNRQRGKVEAV